MIPSQSELSQLHANICSGLADPKRIAILYALSDEAAHVSDLTDRLDLPQSTVSRHLAILRAASLVQADRQGVNVFYQLTDTRVIAALDLMRDVLHTQVARQAQALEPTQESSQESSIESSLETPIEKE